MIIPRKKKQITRCPHTDMKHYAKGMCNHCYHLYGRSSLATKCPHTDKLTYAKGMCQNCYFSSYNNTKRQDKKKEWLSEWINIIICIITIDSISDNNFIS